MCLSVVPRVVFGDSRVLPRATLHHWAGLGAAEMREGPAAWKTPPAGAMEHPATVREVGKHCRRLQCGKKGTHCWITSRTLLGHLWKQGRAGTAAGFTRKVRHCT